MIAEDFGPLRTRSLERALATESLQPGSARGLPLAWESLAGTTVEVARARRGAKDRRGLLCKAQTGVGQHSLPIRHRFWMPRNTPTTKQLPLGTSDLVRYAG